jgi:hypothetical protein
LSTIEVSRYGKNLLSNDILDFENNWSVFSGSTKRYDFPKLIPNQSYTFSFESLKTLNSYGYFRLYKTNGTENTVVTRFSELGPIRTHSATFTVEEETTYFLYLNTSGASGMLTDGKFSAIGNFQLEPGTSRTAYEPYIEPTTYQVNANGIVDGVTSISPKMTLVSSNDGAVINCTYNVDTKTYIDNKFAELQALILEG